MSTELKSTNIPVRTDIENKMYVFEHKKYGTTQTHVTNFFPGRPWVVTYHDIGLTGPAAFTRFFNLAATEKDNLIKDFSVLHITAPGQHFGADDISTNVSMLDMQELVLQIKEILNFFDIDRFLAMGMGAGAYLMTSFATQNPQQVAAMILLGATSRALGWIEWGKKLMGDWLGDNYFTQFFLDRWFGWDVVDSADMVETYKAHLAQMPRTNVIKFVQGYQSRNDITSELHKLHVPIFLCFGDATFFEAEATHFQSKSGIDRALMTWARVEQTGMLVCEHKPNELMQPINLMLNGMGYFRALGGVKKL